MGALAHLQDTMEQQGIAAVDFPTAFVIHEFLAVAFLASTWGVCYYLQPSQSPLLRPLTSALQHSENRAVVALRNGFCSMVASAEAKIAASPR
jgi:hypothetical protein